MCIIVLFLAVEFHVRTFKRPTAPGKLVFEEVITNTVNSWNQAANEFVAPSSGLYSFYLFPELSIYFLINKWTIRKNGFPVFGWYGTKQQLPFWQHCIFRSRDYQRGFQKSLQLKAGDKIDVTAEGHFQTGNNAEKAAIKGRIKSWLPNPESFFIGQKIERNK